MKTLIRQLTIKSSNKLRSQKGLMKMLQLRRELIQMKTLEMKLYMLQDVFSMIPMVAGYMKAIIIASLQTNMEIPLA